MAVKMKGSTAVCVHVSGVNINLLKLTFVIGCLKTCPVLLSSVPGLKAFGKGRSVAVDPLTFGSGLIGTGLNMPGDTLDQ